MSSKTSMPSPESTAGSVTPLRLILAFLAIYFIWGSTYLAIALLIETLPGFVMVGIRFVLAGLILGVLAWARGAPLPTGAELRGASLIGVMLLFGGTGAVVWAADHLPSGLLAVLVAMEPVFIALLQWGGGRRPSLATFFALGLGFLGAAVLAAPDDVLHGTPVHLPSVLVILVGCFSWAAGSLHSRRVALPTSGAMVAAVQMLAGGGALLAFGLARGELRAFDPASVSTTSVLAFLYLVTFGSLIAFSAYSWLIRVVEPTLVATHTYVNPAVAVFLGWWLADEIVGPRVLGATTLIIASVILLTTQEARTRRRSRRRRHRADPEPSAEKFS